MNFPNEINFQIKSNRIKSNKYSNQIKSNIQIKSNQINSNQNLPIQMRCFTISSKLNWIGHVKTLNLPWVAKVEPIVRFFDLFAIANALKEHAILVTKTVTPSRIVESRQRIHEASY